MYNVNLENQLILVDIVDRMGDYVSLQPDIDESKVKAASIIAQNIDVQRVIGEANVQRAISPQDAADEALKELLIPAICYFTYSRLLKMFQGVMTDGGLVVEEEATNTDISKSVSNEHAAVAEVFLQRAVDYLKEEDQNDENVKEDLITPRIRVFGGKENRASN